MFPKRESFTIGALYHQDIAIQNSSSLKNKGLNRGGNFPLYLNSGGKSNDY